MLDSFLVAHPISNSFNVEVDKLISTTNITKEEGGTLQFFLIFQTFRAVSLPIFGLTVIETIALLRYSFSRLQCLDRCLINYFESKSK
jgi:hypothetical protein